MELLNLHARLPSSLSDSEISRLLDLLSSSAWRRERAFIMLGLLTGRMTSMLSLRVGDVTIAVEI